MAAFAQSPAPELGLPEVVVYDDVPELIAERQRAPIPTVQASLHRAVAGGSAGAAAAPQIAPPPIAPAPWRQSVEPPPLSAPRTSEAARLKPRPEDALLLISRNAVYALGGLLLAVFLGALVAGYLIGRGQRTGPASPSAAEAEPGAEPVELDGSVIYSLAPGQYKPDAGAVAIALPVDRRPPEKLPSVGLRPDDDVESHWAPMANALAGFGAALARANDEGDFQLVVPKPGEYHLLLLSRHAKRPASQAIDKAVLDELAAYFADGAGLVGAGKFAWSRRRLRGVPTPLRHDFGLDGK